MKVKPTKLIGVIGIVAVTATSLFYWQLEQKKRSAREILTNLDPAAPHIPQTRSVRMSGSPPSASNPAASLLAPIIRPVLGLDGRTNYLARLEAVHTLRKDLNKEEIEGLYAYLRSRVYPADERERRNEHALKNDVIKALKNQTRPPVELKQVLVALFRDAQQDVVMRDYALQHLISGYDAQQHALIAPVLQAGLAETQSSIAGTALLGLSRLAETDAQFDQAEIGKAALKIAGQSDAGELARITALQICGQRSLKEALPLAVEFVEKSESNSLQISGLAAIGSLGGAQQIEVVERIIRGGDPHLEPAATAALQLLRQRTGTQKTAALRP